MENLNEKWKDIPNFEGYQVSNLGRIRSLPRQRTKGTILKQQSNCNGYCRIMLCKKFFYVHRLVAAAFNPIPAHLTGIEISKLEVDHINGIVNDNRFSNLRWCNRIENCNYELHLKNISKAFKGRPSWNKGKKRPLSESAYETISRKAKERFKIKENTPYYNKGKTVIQYSLDGKPIKEWINITRAAEFVGCSPTLIQMCCLHYPKHKTAKGYKWEYKKDDA